MKKTVHGVVALLLVFGWLSLAVAAEHPAQELAVGTSQKIIAKIKADRAAIDQEPELLTKMVEEIVLPHFDFTKMASWVLGKYWRKADDKQKARFTEEFRQLLVRTYSKALLEAVDKKITYLPLRGDPTQDDITVRTEVEQPGAFPLPIDYKMHEKDGAWKVYDVVIDNISIVSNYRSSFSSQIRKDGIDKLIASLADRNSKGKE